MKLIRSNAKFIKQEPGLDGVYKAIELSGRTCYRSQDKITEDSSKDFVERMIKSGHTAMLEHGTVYLKMPVKYIDVSCELEIPIIHDLVLKYMNNPYSRVFIESISEDEDVAYVTTNYRVLIENNWLNDLKYICEPTAHHEKRYTVKFITDRGVSHELVRHRVFSFAQESTRYCNYSKDKFGNELTFIIPTWLDMIPEGDYEEWTTLGWSEEWSRIAGSKENYEAIIDFLTNISQCQATYMNLLNNDFTPQQARQVLPNSLKTEIVMTGFASDWRHFFDLRLFGKTGKPHPDMEVLASKLKTEFNNAGVWEDIMKHESKFHN